MTESPQPTLFPLGSVRPLRAGRVPCVNPRCRRTAPADRHDPGSEIVCGQCWRLLPKRMTRRYRALRKRERRLLRLVEKAIARRRITAARVDRLHRSIRLLCQHNWGDIRSYFLSPEQPEGLAAFLEAAPLLGVDAGDCGDNVAPGGDVSVE